jgi:hypothetical protein
MKEFKNESACQCFPLDMNVEKAQWQFEDIALAFALCKSAVIVNTCNIFERL